MAVSAHVPRSTIELAGCFDDPPGPNGCACPELDQPASLARRGPAEPVGPFSFLEVSAGAAAPAGDTMLDLDFIRRHADRVRLAIAQKHAARALHEGRCRHCTLR